MTPWLHGDHFPSVERARADGLLARGGRLAPELLLTAYRRGIFPWSSDPVVTWWSPDPRAVFDLSTFRSHSSLERSIRRGGWVCTVDRDFSAVMMGCAELGPKRDGTWISPEFIAAYSALHRLGHAHSVEVWEEGELVGGLYGVTIGAFYGGESMFHRRTDASKAALGYLVERLRAGNFQLLDAQIMNPHLDRLGAIQIPRAAYLARLNTAIESEATLCDATPGLPRGAPSE